MIVDDEPASLQLMRSLAAPLKHSVLAFDDTKKAEQTANEQRFDVIFVGMRLPELELARQIRSSQPNGETTIVMLSATKDIPSLREAFGAGVDLILTKPVRAAHLSPMLAAMDSPGWKNKRHAARLPLFTNVTCKWEDRHLILRSVNISESGMLLQPSIDAELGQEVSLELKLAEARASVSPRARITRKEGSELVAVEFIDLAPEDRNAIQIYVMGRLASGQVRTEKWSRPWWAGRGFINSR